MRQLGGHHAALLDADSAHAPASVTFVQFYDPLGTRGGRVRFEALLRHIGQRLPACPLLRSRLLRVPLGIDRPYWVDDADFDLEYHVRHIALPAPGDWPQFCAQAARIHARPLDLGRPPWEVVLVEGLDSIAGLPRGSFALLTRIHRAAADLDGGMALVQALHDRVARPRRRAPPEPWLPQPAPRPARLAAQAAVRAAASPRRWLQPLGRALPAAAAFARDVLRPQVPAPATRFDAVVTPHRVFDMRRFALDDCHRIGALVPGATVADVAVATCGGALRRYLQALGELPAADVPAIVPLAVAGADPAPAAPGAAPWVRVALGTAIADPLQRLQRVHAQSAGHRARDRAADADTRVRVAERLPAAALALAGRLLGRRAVQSLRGLPQAACTLVDIGATGGPMYLCGARLTTLSALLPIADGSGLALALGACEDRLVVAFTSCRELMPDPQAFARCLRDSFEEYRALATAATAPAAPRRRARAGEPAPATAATPGAPASARSSPSGRGARTSASRPRAARGGRPRSTAPGR